MSTKKSENTEARVVDGEPSVLEEFVGYNLKRAYMIVQADFRAAVQADQFSARVFSALSLVVQFPNITQSALARLLGIERSGLVAIVADLENRGYLNRAQVRGDRRVQALVPTNAGRAAYKQAHERALASEDRVLSCLSSDERATLLRLLKKIMATESQQ